MQPAYTQSFSLLSGRRVCAKKPRKGAKASQRGHFRPNWHVRRSTRLLDDATHPDGLPSLPNFLRLDGSKLLGEVLGVRLASIELERAAGLGPVADGGVKLFKHRLVGLVELRSPVESATTSGGRALWVERARGAVGREWREWREGEDPKSANFEHYSLIFRLDGLGNATRRRVHIIHSYRVFSRSGEVKE